MLSDREIRKRVQTEGLLQPFVDNTSEARPKGIISYGLTSCGYDLRLARELLVFREDSKLVVDPKRFADQDYQNAMFRRLLEPDSDGTFTLPPHSYALGMSMEYINMPRDLCALCLGKSTYARSGIIINTTPAEPLWRGYLTIEISNSSPCPARLYPGEGIAQMQFFKIDGEVETSYADKRGIYQDQFGVTTARVR